MPYSKFETVVIMLKFKRKKNIFDCTKYKELLVSHNPGKPLPGKGFGDPEQAFRLFWPAVLGRTKKCKTHFRAVFFCPQMRDIAAYPGHTRLSHNFCPEPDLIIFSDSKAYKYEINLHDGSPGRCYPLSLFL